MTARTTTSATTLAGEASLRQEIRKSRFIAHAASVASADAALAFVAGASEREATHNCWAYRIGPAYRFSDDGEPGGSAGRPILAAIEGQSLDQVAVVVTRWYGGIKLGVGGLARAYGGCAAECLRTAEKRALIVHAHVVVHCDFAAAAVLRMRLRDVGAIKRDERADAAGIALVLDVPADNVAAFAALVRDISHGRAQMREATSSDADFDTQR